MNKKIAMVINTSWNIYNFRKNLVEYLLRQGHELYLIAPRDQYTAEIEKWEAYYYELPMDNTGSNPIRDLTLLRRFIHLYKKVKPDVILHYTIKPNIYGSLAARYLGIPCINNVSGLGTVFLQQNISSFFARILYKMAFGPHCHIFFQNPDDQKDFRKVIRFGSSDSVIPGSGINLSTNPEDSASRLEDKKSLIFLMVGRLLIEKGVMEFLEAARHFRDNENLEFWLAGALDASHIRGVKQAYIYKLQEKGVINYLGHVQPISSTLTRADWVILPSYREGTPRSLLEAAALSKPMITCNVPGCREVVQDNVNGFLCQPRSSPSLIAAIEKALTVDKKKRISMGKASRKLVEDKFDEQIVFKAYHEQINIMTQKSKNVRS